MIKCQYCVFSLFSIYSTTWEQKDVQSEYGLWLVDWQFLSCSLPKSLVWLIPSKRQPTVTSHFPALPNPVSADQWNPNTIQTAMSRNNWTQMCPMSILCIVERLCHERICGWKWNFIRSIMSGSVNNELLTCTDMLTSQERLVCPKAYYESIHSSKFSDIMFSGHDRT